MLLLTTTFIFSQQFLGTSSSSGQIYRNGTVKLGATGKGFVIASGNTDTDSDWGGHWYGMSRGNPSLMNLSTGSAGNPVSINGYKGIGFRTQLGRVAFLQNGIVTIGLSKSRINLLKDTGTGAMQHRLYVGGGIRAEDIKVDLQTAWADYVFAKDYKLMPLPILRKFILEKGHLPNMPTSEDIKKEGGISVSEIIVKQQEKIEELTLYILALEEKVNNFIDK